MKKIISIALVVMMLASCLCMNAFATADGYAYQWDDTTGAYFYADFAQTAAKWEFDFCPINTSAEVRSYMGNEFVMNFTNGTIGVGSTTLLFNWTSGAWYHIVLDGTSGSGTTVTVNGTVVGTVATTLYARWCAGTINVAIDNLVCSTGYSENFDDLSFDGINEANGKFITIGTPAPDPDPVDPDPVDPVDDMGYMARLDDYGTIAKGVDRCDGPSEANNATVEFDLILLPGENNATPTFQIFDSFEGSTRIVLTPTSIGYFYTFTEEEGNTSFNWGDLTVSNQRHFKYVHTTDDIKVYIDGTQVYTIGYGCAPAMSSLVVYMTNGSCLIDNLKITDTANGNVLGQFDFTQMPDCDNAYQVYVGDCTKGHVKSNSWTTGTAPTCTTSGYVYQKCLVCGNDAGGNTVAALGHNFGSYAEGMATTAATATTDGVKTWTCKRCSTVSATGVIPATGDYTGTIDSFDSYDNDDLSKYVIGGFKNFYDAADYVEDFEGEGIVYGEENNYMNFYSGGNYHQFPDINTNGFTASFDFRFNDTYETDATGAFGHTVHFWFGGSNNLSNIAGYDADNDVFYIQPESGFAYDRVESEALGIKAGEWHNITFRFVTNKSTGYTTASFELDGEEKLVFDDLDASMNLPFPVGQVTFPLIMRIFGLNCDFDNYVIGSTDFKWNTFRTPASDVTVVPGDVDGDGELSLRDSRQLKKVLLGTLSETEIVFANADMDGDGELSLRDSRALRAMLLAQ